MSDTTDTVVPTRNQPLFYLVAMQFEAHPDTYNQEYYASRKWSWRKLRKVQQGCVASWAAVLANRLLFPPRRQPRCWPIVALPGEGALSPAREAREALGLTHPEAEILFSVHWVPPFGRTVPEALRAYGDGAPIER